MLNCSYQIEHSNGLIGLRQHRVVYDSISPSVTSTNLRFSETNARNLINTKHYNNIMALSIIEIIELLKILKTHNEKMDYFAQVKVNLLRSTSKA
jgi:hypothetical protein